METEKKKTGEGKFVLQIGEKIFFSDIKIELSLSEKNKISILSKIENENEILHSIRLEINKWLKYYADKAVFINATIIHVGFQDDGEFQVKKGVSLAFHDGLPKIGINPPQIFG